MNNKEEIEGFRLRLTGALAQAGMSQAELARAIGEKPQLISKWLNYDQTRLPGATYVAKVADVLGVNLVWLITGEGSRSSNVLVQGEVRRANDFVDIPEYSVTFGAGEAPEPTYDELTETVPATYRRDFFTSRGIKPQHCKRVRVHGDSMEPLILDGDCILIDCSPVEHLENGAIYAIAYDHTLMVKRLIRQFGQLLIKSENPAYPDVTLKGEDADNVLVLGKVIERSGTL